MKKALILLSFFFAFVMTSFAQDSFSLLKYYPMRFQDPLEKSHYKEIIFTDSCIYEASVVGKYDYSHYYSKKYYLSDSPDKNPNMSLCGKVKKGKYIIIDNELKPNVEVIGGGPYSKYKIVHFDQSMFLLDMETDGNYIHPFYPVNISSADTIALRIMQKELRKGVTYEKERCFFHAFPSTWKDFLNTFNSQGKGMTKDMKAFVDRFMSLKTIHKTAFCRKLITLVKDGNIEPMPGRYMQKKVREYLNGRKRSEALNDELISYDQETQAGFRRFLMR